MRLSLVFLGVLAASVLLASLAVWGITFGTSHSRVMMMSSEFTTVAHNVLGQFDAFVTELLQNNAKVVDGILTAERLTGETRIQQSQTMMVNTIGALVNYTTNATDQSQQQMNDVVDMFADLMHSVIIDFKGVATSYSAQLRAALVAKAAVILQQTILTKDLGLYRFQMFLENGLLNFSKLPTDPVGPDDCLTLGLLCATMSEMLTAEQVVLAMATGRSYICTAGKEASIRTITLNGTMYREQLVTWVPTASTVLKMKKQCLTQPPVVIAGKNCSQSQGCSCGQDQRCSGWFMEHLEDTSPSKSKGTVYRMPSGSLASTFSYSLFDPDAPTPSLVGVVSNNIQLTGIDRFLAALITLPNTTLASVHNDTVLTMTGTTGVKCAPNEIPPGDPTLPAESMLRTCDPAMQPVAQWLDKNRAGGSVQVNGVVWDIFPTQLAMMSYYLIVGTPLSVINAAADASDARATAELNTVRTGQLSRVAASGAATKAYMGAMGAENIQASRAMEAEFFMQIREMENTSLATLASSQQRSAAQVQQLKDSQTTEIKSLTSKHLDGMAEATGWTIAVAFSILILVLLCGTWGTVRITNSLTNIIGLMEDVADMKVEDLTVPQRSHVTEVARIETAFQVLVRRLAEYKSYIPAGVFEKMAHPELNHDTGFKHWKIASPRSTPRKAKSDCTSTTCSSPTSSPHHQLSPHAEDNRILPVMPSKVSNGSMASVSTVAFTPHHNSNRQRMAALSFYVFDFTEMLLQRAPVQAKGLLSQYITHVHEAASQSHGNVDFLAGDQILVTFNAHIPCSDPAGSALTAALEMQRLLWQGALKFQIGISYGQVLAGSVGYAKFRSMVALGGPIKVASMISQVSGFDSGNVLIDATLEEGMKYLYDLRPVEIVHFPQLKALASYHKNLHRRVFLVKGKRQLDEDEWLYQVDKMAPSMDEWSHIFEKVAEATTTEEALSHVQGFLAGHAGDAVALRLKERLPLWIPGLGIPLWDRAEHSGVGHARTTAALGGAALGSHSARPRIV